MQTPVKILATTYMVVHTTRRVSRTTFWFDDTNTQTHTDTLKTIPAFTVTAGNKHNGI